MLLQIILILINAFFAAAEMAVVSLNPNKVRKNAEEGDKKSAQLLILLESPNNFLSTIQVAITLAGLLGSAFAADNFAARLANWVVYTQGFTLLSYNAVNTISVILITIILSYFTLILGELVPKRIAMEKAEWMAKVSLNTITGLAKIMRPVIWFLSKSTNAVLRLLKINTSTQDDLVTEEEIRMMVDIGEEKGVIQSNEKEMIENIFEFNNISASDVMVHRTNVSTIWVEDSHEVILDIICKTGLNRFPVYNEDIDDIVGVLNTREFLLNSVKENPLDLRGLLRQAYFVPETVPADALFRDMQTNKIHMSIVVDEYGGMSGIVTMEDLLEEIVGNIYDEFDPVVVQDIIKLSDNLWRIRGSVDLETISKELGVELPLEEEYDTLGGMIFDQFTTIPKDGSHPELDIFNLHIYVERITDHRIQSALVSILSPATPDEDTLLPKDNEE
ncbi:MAG: HlyC/CorC family transporter [Clostridiales bacterium]|nr:HlyC/CorC family transporter [Clostridiales bacterium]